jgi:hypothetical protein
MRTRRWSDDVIEKLLEAIRSSPQRGGGTSFTGSSRRCADPMTPPLAFVGNGVRAARRSQPAPVLA